MCGCVCVCVLIAINLCHVPVYSVYRIILTWLLDVIVDVFRSMFMFELLWWAAVVLYMYTKCMSGSFCRPTFLINSLLFNPPLYPTIYDAFYMSYTCALSCDHSHHVHPRLICFFVSYMLQVRPCLTLNARCSYNICNHHASIALTGNARTTLTLQARVTSSWWVGVDPSGTRTLYIHDCTRTCACTCTCRWCSCM